MARRNGRFVENIAHFVRLLRDAGLPVGPERTSLRSRQFRLSVFSSATISEPRSPRC